MNYTLKKKKSAKAENRTRIARITALNTDHCTTLAINNVNCYNTTILHMIIQLFEQWVWESFLKKRIMFFFLFNFGKMGNKKNEMPWTRLERARC